MTPEPPPAAVLSYRRAAGVGDSPDECYRCGYPLLGIDDENACPECGLLARRSRRKTDELHDTRPRWLRRISLGANLLLLAIPVIVVWPFVWQSQVQRTFRGWPARGFDFAMPLIGFDLAALLLIVGAWLLTSPEGYPPADRADRRLRWSLRVAAFVPLIAMLLCNVLAWRMQRGWVVPAAPVTVFGVPSLADVLWWMIEMFVWLLCTLGLAPLPLLLFAQLRGLAKRARSAHLAEHCMIVGIGTSASVLLAGTYALLSHNARRWGMDHYWTTRSIFSLLLMLALGVAGGLFTMWSVYLFVRFALAFRRAARELRGKWTNDDRSVTAMLTR